VTVSASGRCGLDSTEDENIQFYAEGNSVNLKKIAETFLGSDNTFDNVSIIVSNDIFSRNREKLVGFLWRNHRP